VPKVLSEAVKGGCSGKHLGPDDWTNIREGNCQVMIPLKRYESNGRREQFRIGQVRTSRRTIMPWMLILIGCGFGVLNSDICKACGHVGSICRKASDVSGIFVQIEDW